MRSAETEIAALRSALEAGIPWREAHRTYVERSTGAPPAEWPPADGCVNWTWLIDLPDDCRVVDLGSPLGELTWHLAAEFPSVRYLGCDGEHGSVVRSRFRDSPSVEVRLSDALADPLEGVEADCVVLMATPGWRARVPAALARTKDLPGAIHRILKPGGWFAYLGPNPSCISGAAFRSGGVRGFFSRFAEWRALRDGIGRSGFSEVRTYLTSPDPGLQLHIVPQATGALRALRNVTAGESDFTHLLPARVAAFRFAASMLLARR